jgi:hypothetical protein
VSLKFPASIPVANLIPNNALQVTSGPLRVPAAPERRRSAAEHLTTNSLAPSCGCTSEDPDSGFKDIPAPAGFWEGATLPGRQLNFSIRGEQYEKAFDAIASRFLSVVRVPRPDDYGIDAYCHIRSPLDAISSTVGGAFGVQIRGPGCNMQFGGMNDRGDAWKSYEIEWLRSLALPLYLARVSTGCTRVDFYSLWPVWLVLGGSPAPFRIICEFDDPSKSPFTLPEATKEADGSCGDGTTWTVPLGPPFLSVSQEQLSDRNFNEPAAVLMWNWVEFDRMTVIRFLLRVAYFVGAYEWLTNDFDFTKAKKIKGWMAWSPLPGQNIDDLCGVFEPTITNLGVHLQHQDDVAA